MNKMGRGLALDLFAKGLTCIYITHAAIFPILPSTLLFFFLLKQNIQVNMSQMAVFFFFFPIRIRVSSNYSLQPRS